MTTPAGTISEAILFCPDNIAELSFDNIVSIKTRMLAWINGMFGPTGIFTDVENAGQRTVIDWYGANNMALDTMTGGFIPGTTGVVETAAAIEAVIRTCYAVRQSQIVGYITTTQRNAVVTLFNAQWT